MWKILETYNLPLQDSHLSITYAEGKKGITAIKSINSNIRTPRAFSTYFIRLAQQDLATKTLLYVLLKVHCS